VVHKKQTHADYLRTDDRRLTTGDW
jgi:hypothetical protein